MSAANNVDLVNKYADQILDIIYDRDKYTTSDLQGMVSAIVLSIINDAENGKDI